MLNVTIQNDGKIKIQMECSDVKEMRSNVNLLLAIVSSMETEGQTDREDDRISRKPIYHLYLNFVQNNNRLSTVKEISEQLNISLQNAKSTVDSAADGKKVLLTQSFDKSFIDKIKNALEAKECICEITKN
jgi:ribosomal protein L7/L12